MKLKALFLGLFCSASTYASGGFGGAYVGFSAKTEVVSNSANQNTAASVCLSPYNWIGRIKSNSGSIASESIAIGRNLISAVSNKSYLRKIIFLYPVLDNLTAARCPILYNGSVGPIAGNNNFVSGDFGQSTGLQGDGTTKSLDTLVFPGTLGSSNNGGLGYGENNISFAGTAPEPIGCYSNDNTERFVVDLRAAVRSFRWGEPVNGSGDSSLATNGRYYGQRSSATSRELFFNGSSLGTNSTSDAASLSNNRTILLVGSNGRGNWAGRMTFAYLTDGTMSSGEVSDFDTVLVDYILTPTGR